MGTTARNVLRSLREIARRFLSKFRKTQAPAIDTRTLPDIFIAKRSVRRPNVRYPSTTRRPIKFYRRLRTLNGSRAWSE